MLGICAGLQMLGDLDRRSRRCRERGGHRRRAWAAPGTHRVRCREGHARCRGAALGEPLTGYQIHHGRASPPRARRSSCSTRSTVRPRGRRRRRRRPRPGTTVHGLFESDTLRTVLLAGVAARRGPASPPAACSSSDCASSDSTVRRRGRGSARSRRIAHDHRLGRLTAGAAAGTCHVPARRQRHERLRLFRRHGLLQAVMLRGTHQPLDADRRSPMADRRWPMADGRCSLRHGRQLAARLRCRMSNGNTGENPGPSRNCDRGGSPPSGDVPHRPIRRHGRLGAGRQVGKR